MAMTPEQLRDLDRRYEELRSRRSAWDSAWKELALHFLPTRCRDASKGDAAAPLLNNTPVDSTGILAMRTLAAGMQGGMTSPARPWFALKMSDDAAEQTPGARMWLDEVLRRMRDIFHRSNFYNAIHTVYGELGTFGTAFLFEFADMKHGFRFVPLTAGEYVLDVDERGRVDTVIRAMRMTARQMVREFGAENVPETVRKALDRPSRSTERRTVMHAVYPRNDRHPRALDGRNKPWASVYWCGGVDSGGGGAPHLLREGGFDGFPGFGPRWDATAEDVYGRSPAMDVLPDCRMLQQMARTTLKAIHKSVDPPMSVAAGLRSVGLDLTAGGLNFVDGMPGQAPRAATPLLQVRPDIQAARVAIQDVQNQIRTGLYNDLFRMLLGSDRRQVTATEVDAREQEKMVLIGPVLERLHDELFIPLIDRTFNLMAGLNMLPPAPPELSGSGVRVEFVSLLAQAQKIVSTGAVSQFVDFVGRTAQAWPEALDAVDIDKVASRYGEYLGVESSIIRSVEEREQLRRERAQARARAAQQEQAAQTVRDMRGAADTARTLSQTPVDPNGVSALEAVIGGMGGL